MISVAIISQANIDSTACNDGAGTSGDICQQQWELSWTPLGLGMPIAFAIINWTLSMWTQPINIFKLQDGRDIWLPETKLKCTKYSDSTDTISHYRYSSQIPTESSGKAHRKGILLIGYTFRPAFEWQSASAHDLQPTHSATVSPYPLFGNIHYLIWDR
jgi:hypothetical protein